MTIKPNGFKYSSDSTGVVNLVNSVSRNAVSDNTHKNPLPKYSPVVAVSTVDGTSYAAVGFATGEIVDAPANSIWPQFDSNGVVHEVQFLSRVYELPAGEFDLGTQALPLATVTQIADWAIDKA